MQQLVCCNIIVILIDLSAFIGPKSNNRTIMYGTENVNKIRILLITD